jgi:AhpD family alkylhydroperoxidase
MVNRNKEGRAVLAMNREEIYREMTDMLGLVPTMFKVLPDSSIELEWNLFKKIQMEQSPIPSKYRELIGVAIAATTKCRYCALFHTEMAKLNGATDEEIEDAVHFAKSSAGWSAYLNGMQIDFEQFSKEIHHACEHVRSKQKALV